MWKHFDNMKAAIDHLRENGWRSRRDGSLGDMWISKDKTCLATTHRAGGDVVAVWVTEAERAA